MEEGKVYGQSRERGANVSHAEIERAALDILGSERRPSVETVRALLGRGSPATIATGLKRFWRDLGIRAQGDPASLTRLPSEIIEAVESIWQRALTLAAQSAKNDHNAARERLEQLRIENEVRAQSFDLRERGYETAARERERALADSRDHLLATLRMLETDRATLAVRESRIAELELQLAESRRRLARFMAQTLSERSRRAKKGKSPSVKKRRTARKARRPLARAAPRRPRR